MSQALNMYAVSLDESAEAIAETGREQDAGS
jgi:hypothetical protein